MSNYTIYPSLMDAYVWMQSAEDEAQYYQRKQEMIDKINRVPTEPSSAASRGTALNNLVDSILQTSIVDDNSFYHVEQDGFVFDFDKTLVHAIAANVADCVSQPFTSAAIPTDHGMVQLYGYADYVLDDTIIDLKTTSSYAAVGKYRDHWQHLVYPYCMVNSGQMSEFSTFIYLVAEIKSGQDSIIRGELYAEEYNPTIEQCEQAIRHFLDTDMLPFLEDNRQHITDGKIFGE